MGEAPTKAWTKLLGGASADYANSVSTANDGSIYIAGITYGNLDNNINAGKIDAFLSKYNSDGTKSWTRLLGTSGDDYAYSVTTGSDGSIYIAGGTEGNLDGNSSAGDGDAFLSKYKSDGTKSWTRLLGTSAYDYAYSVTTGSDGSIYIAGGTEGNLDGNSNAGGSDAFLSKYNSDGTKSWTRLLGTSGVDPAKSVTTGSDGSIYIAGITQGNLDGNSNAGIADAFLSKYNSDGTKSWTRLLGSSASDGASSVTTGSDGSIYIAGITYGKLDGNSNDGSADAFLSKYNSDGTKSWTRLLGSSVSDEAQSVTTGSDGSIYIAGITSGKLDGNSNAGGSDAFLSKYNSDGTKSWTRLLGTYGSESANSVTTGSDGSIHITGVTGGNLDGNSNTGSVDAFLSKFSFPPTYILTPSTTSINEGAVLTNTVTTTNVATGTKLYYSLSGTGITTADFAAGALTGEGVTDAAGKFTFTHTLANDLTTEGAESLSIKLYSDSARTLQVGSTATVSFVDSSTTAPLVVRGNSLYTIVDGPSWTQAEANSVKLGGHLVTINDLAENIWVSNRFIDHSSDRYYLGLNDKKKEGNLEWSSGEELKFERWNSPEEIKNNNETSDVVEYIAQISINERLETTYDGHYAFRREELSGLYLASTGISETPFIRRGDSGYVIVSGPTWEEAEANAVKLGGHLVTINDAAEEQFLLSNTSGGWIGYTDKSAEGKWVWIDGTPKGYERWDPTNPSNNWGLENYAYLDKGAYVAYGAGWNDIPNDYWNYMPQGNNPRMGGIAEIKLAPNNTPTGTPTVTGTFKVGSTLTIDTTAIKDSDNFTGYTPTFKYNWETSTDGTTWSKLTTTDGADNNNTYILTAAEASKKIRGVVSYLDGYGTNEVVNSAASESIANVTPTYTLTPSLATIDEGAVLTSTVATTNVATGTKLYYALSGTRITTADFSAGALTGEGVTDATGKFTFTHTIANDLTTEGAETLNIKLFTDSARTVQVGSTATVSVVDSSITAPLVVRGNSLYTIVDGPSWTQAEANSVKLGGHLVAIESKSENDFIWAVFGPSNTPADEKWIGLSDAAEEGVWKWSNGENVVFTNWASVAPANTSGITYPVGQGKDTQDYVNFWWGSNDGRWDDYFVDGNGGNSKGIAETPFIRRGDSAYVIVQGPTWEEAEANAVKLGGHLVTINDAAENEWINLNFKNLQYSVLIGNSEKQALNTREDFWIGLSRRSVGSQWEWSDGSSVSYQNWNGAGLTFNLTAEIIIGSDPRWKEKEGSWNAENTPWHDPNYPINDNDRFQFGIAEIKLAPATPTYSLSTSSTTINEGSILTTTVNTTDVASGSTLYYSLSGDGINSSDFSSGALTGSGSVSSSGSFVISHTLANDLTTEGAETLNIKLFTDSARTVQVGSTASVSIADTSLTQVAKDTTPPTIALTTNKASLTAGEQATITFTISEDSTDFTSSDITTSSGGTLSDFKGSGKIYTATFTPKANTQAAAFVSVASKTFSDSASNFNNDEVEANNKITFFVDTVIAPGVKITLPGDLTTDENGKSVVIPLVLKTEPKAAVRLDFILSKGAEATLSTKSLEFSTTNWSTPQSLTLKGIEDYVDDIDQKYSLTITGSSTDKSYQTSTDPKGLQIPVINLINLDDGEDEGKSIYGDAGAQPIKDTLKGTEGPDRVYGLLEDDILYGAAGKDLIFGGYGNDILYGEISDDELYGQDEDDTLYGGEGNDRLTGGEGFDKLIGGAGNDTYVIDDERDTIDDQGLDADIDTVLFRANLTTYTMPASIKNAVLDSGSAFELIGNALNNNLTGNSNNNEIDGGAGDDLINGGKGNDLLKGGSGSDTAHYHKQLPGFTFGAEGGAGITANLLTGKASGTEIGNDTLVAIENIETSDGSDTLIGNENANTLIANGGNDLLEANGGDDNLIGGQGDDQLDGGAGEDQAVYSGVRDDYEVSQDSTGTKVIIKDKRQFQDGIDTITGIETVKFANQSLVLADLTSKTLDFNGDGNVDSFDSILMMRHMMGTYPGESIKKDIPGKFDLTAIQRKLTNAFADTFSLNGGLLLDIDGDKRISAFRDGMMITQHILKQGTSDSPWAPPGFNPPDGFPAQMQQHLKDLIGF